METEPLSGTVENRRARGASRASGSGKKAASAAARVHPEKGFSRSESEAAAEEVVRSAGKVAAAKGSAERGPKPKKPYPAFPLFAHATGRWAKKINGRFVFFGPWRDPHGALDRYLAQRDELHAGRVPRRRSDFAPAGQPEGRGDRFEPRPTARAGKSAGSGGAAVGGVGVGAGVLTIRDLANHFLTAKQRRVESGEMGSRSFNDYHRTSAMLVKFFGADRRVDHLTSIDFGRLRTTLAKRYGAVMLGNQVGRIRSVFKYGYEASLLDRPMRFGPEFTKPARRLVRQERSARGERMYTPAEIRSILEAAGPQMKAMVLLGLNCGMGNTDVASLPRAAVDHKKAMVIFPRPKTGISRRCPLWPETLAAIAEVERVRPRVLDEAHGDLVFITKYGRPWVRVDAPGERSKGKNHSVVKDAVTTEFNKLLRSVGIQGERRGFYALRHTFRTVADEVGDRRAVDLIMGHENSEDISTAYVERVADERLVKVTEHVKGWLASGSRRTS